MAKILGKDQATYAKERDGFLRDLQHFHDTRGTPFKRAPTLGGREVDLYLLYSLVTSQGGWIKVNSRNSWKDLLPSLKIPTHCVNGSVALKQIYLRYLDRWEKVHYLHEEADRGSDDDEESRHKRWSARALHSVPYTYNYNVHNVADTSRDYNHLSTDLYKPSDYDRLALSLISPLPNEQDFAINVCTLLSNDGKHTLKLEKHPRIINYLLGHAGIFDHSSLRRLFIYFYNDVRKKPMHNFWRDVLESQEYLDLTNEDKFPRPNKDGPSTSKDDPSSVPKEEIDTTILAVPMDVDDDRLKAPEETVSENVTNSDCEVISDAVPKDVNCDSLKLKIGPEDDELFSLRCSLGTQDYIGQRVLQIATILRNLSFIEENTQVLVKNTSFVRFLLLCSTSQWNLLRNLGMDMLGNIAAEFIVRDLQTDLLASNMLKIVIKGLESPDRASCLSSLEVLNKLSQNELNEDILLRSLESQVYRSVCSFLTIHDVMLLIYTLECLYSLSSLGERSCNLIVNNHGVIDTLVSLVTVEGKSYGPKACIGMKLVETLPSGGSQSQTQQAVATVAASTVITTVTTSTAAATTPVIVSTPVAPKPVPVTPSTPMRPIQIAPQRLITLTPTSATTPATITISQTTASVMTPQQLIQQQHAHQQAIHENEQFALAWLRATYEPCVDGKVDHQELYKHYMSSCSKIGRRGVISPLHFPRCVRSVFGGTVGPNPMKPANATDRQFYEGIKVRAQPLIISIQSSSPPPQLPNPKTTATAASNNSNSKGGQQVRRKLSQHSIVLAPSPPIVVRSPSSTSLTVVADNNHDGTTPISPASPILKAQLSAPPKQGREGSAASVGGKGDAKSQVMAHPHLSQALLGSSTGTTSTSTLTTISAGPSKETQAGQGTNSSLIKSLLATKVNDCMTTVSMRTATDCQNVAQVAARQQQQRLLAQQGNGTPIQDNQQQKTSNMKSETPKISRLNGARQLFADTDIGDSSISSTTQFTTGTTKGKKEPPQPPPPPLAPLSNNVKGGKSQQRIDNEDSDSIGNNSLASSSGLGTVGVGGVSSTEEGDNSLTSFEGLLNGIPNMENALNEDSNSKDSVKIVSDLPPANKPLRLADLLEKKFEKSPPMLNGVLGKDLRLGEKAMDLVENHIEKVLSRENDVEKYEEVIVKSEVIVKTEIEIKQEVNIKVEDGLDKTLGLKRPATEEIVECQPKKPMLSSGTVNGSAIASATADSPAPESVSSSSNGEEGPATVSTAAAKLFADMAADILEDEDEEQLMQEAQVGTQIVEGQVAVQSAATAQAPVQQIIVDNNQQVLLAQAPRQIIVSQPQMQQSNQVVISTVSGGQLKTQTGQTVIVQNTGSHQRPVMLQQANTGQFLLSQNLQGQMQIVASSQPGQYVLQAGGSQGAYVVAQPQTAVVHGQPQTVLVAQTAQQGQGAGTKTIIILQQQPPNSSATHHQKMMVAPQGQQVVVTQMPRPIVHTSSVTNNVLTPSKTVKGAPTVSSTQTTVASNGMTEKKPEEPKKPRIVRDLTTPYVCEWGECDIETKFKSANEVYLHVCATHCPTGSEEIICQWDRCDNMKRKRFSLMTHLHDKHCNTEAMKQGLVRRKQASQSAKVEPPQSPPSTPHPGYAPDAALHAIKRHALEFVNPKELQLKPSKPGAVGAPSAMPRAGPSPPADQDDNEGPVTKSIRLTASLILRNLVIYSSHCKRYLKSYESHLANVALSNVESSRTIAQVLYDMNDGATHR